MLRNMHATDPKEYACLVYFLPFVAYFPKIAELTASYYKRTFKDSHKHYKRTFKQ